MSEPALLVADAIVDHLSAIEWDLVTEFSRTYLDDVASINDETRRLWVMPGDTTPDGRTRTTQPDEIQTTWLLFVAKVPDATADTLDPLVDLTRAIRNDLAAWSLKREPGFAKYASIGLQTGDIYDFEALRQYSLFLQLFGFRWRWER